VPFGFGTLDYVVCTLVAVATVYMLRHAPHRLLVWLPTFLTINFFIPLESHFTPSRFVPLILGGALILSGRLQPRAGHSFPLIVLALVLAGSTAYAMYIGDAGTRPIFRMLHYVGLIFLFVFLTRLLKTREHIQLALWGLFVAGAIHGGHALYQIIAYETGLPFRGIVYTETSQFHAALTDAGLRVNGLADEPKRLGYVLFCAALAAAYFFVSRSRGSAAIIPFQRGGSVLSRKWFLAGTAGLCLLMSLLTYSGSYFAAVAIVLLVLLLTFSIRTFSYILLAGLIGLMVPFLFPTQFDRYSTVLTNFFEARKIEWDFGLQAQKIYRQEFFGHQYLNENPDSILLGVGIGRYNQVLYARFGAVAGHSDDGIVLPINSQFYELGFDLGLIGLAFAYLAVPIIALRLGRRSIGEYVVFTMLLFLIVQSFFVEDKHILVFVAAIGSSMIAQRAWERVQFSAPHQSRFLKVARKPHFN
jgi:hypothetical protein